MAELGRAVVKIVGDNSELDRAINQSQTKMQRAAQAMQRIGKQMTTFVTLPILAIGAAAVKSAADLELQQAAFQTMLGSAERARDLLDDLQTMAAKTPFQMTDLADGTKTLLAFGTAADDVLPILGQLGDIALGDSQRLKQLALVYGQVQSAGRLMGQDLLQLINVGFNPLQLISEQTGETMAELKTRMEQGAISAEEVAAAFKIATSEGGMFFGGMETASLTLAGKFSTLMDNVAILGRSFADILLPAIKDIVDWATKLVQKWVALDDGSKKIILIVAGVAAAIGPLLIVVGTLTTKIIALNLAMALNPAIAMGLAITAIGVALAGVGIAITTAIRSNREYKNVLFATTQQISQLTDEEKKRAKELLEQRRARLQEKMIHEFEELAEFTQLYAEQTDKASGAAKFANDQITALTRALTENRGEMNDIVAQIAEYDEALKANTEIIEFEIEAVEDLEDAMDELGEAYTRTGFIIGEDFNNVLLESGDIFGQLGLTIGGDFNEALLESGDIFGQLGMVIGGDFNTALLESGQIWGDVTEAARDNTLEQIALRNSIFEDQRLHNERMTAALEEYRAEQLVADEAAAEEAMRIAQELATFRLDIAQTIFTGLIQMIDNLATKEGESARDAAERRKALGLFSVVIDTSIAIMKFMSLAQPLAAAAAAIEGLVQFAVIASTPLPPALAAGGIVTQPTTAVVGEGGQPEIIFPLDQLEDFIGGEGR